MPLVALRPKADPKVNLKKSSTCTGLLQSSIAITRIAFLEAIGLESHRYEGVAQTLRFMAILIKFRSTEDQFIGIVKLRITLRCHGKI